MVGRIAAEKYGEIYMIKFIACDMDGTLLDSKKELPKNFEYVLEELKKKGVIFSISSGRQYDSLDKQFERIRDKIYIIAENGAVVYDDKGQKLLSDPLDKESSVEIIEKVIDEPDLFVVVCGEKSAYGEERNEEILEHVLPYYIKYEAVDSAAKAAVNDNIYKIAIFDKQGSEKHCYPLLKDYYDSHNVFVSGDVWLDVMRKGVTKGSAIRRVQEKLGISRAECMAFGDFMNDYDMMKECEESYAMENAHPELKAICKHIAPSNDDDGVMKSICEVFGIEYR
jgi:Cof subfamily protein (haloacid dehalogenase superfamily)